MKKGHVIVKEIAILYESSRPTPNNVSMLRLIGVESVMPSGPEPEEQKRKQGQEKNSSSVGRPSDDFLARALFQVNTPCSIRTKRLSTSLIPGALSISSSGVNPANAGAAVLNHSRTISESPKTSKACS
jgi:hypothetical protein